MVDDLDSRQDSSLLQPRRQATSSGHGLGSPEGWLWKSTMAAAWCMAAIRKTSRGWTRLVSSVPVDTSLGAEHAVVRAEADDAEALDGAGPVVRQEERRDVARRAEALAVRPRAREGTAAQLDAATTIAARVGVIPLIRARSPVLSCASRCCTFPHASRRAPAAATPVAPTGDPAARRSSVGSFVRRAGRAPRLEETPVARPGRVSGGR